MKKLFLFVLFIALYLSSYSQNPVFEWVKTFGGSNLDVSYQLALDATGNIYVAGRFQGTIDLDPGPGTYNRPSNGVGDFYVLKLDPAGDFIWAKSIGGASNDWATAITLDNSGNPYITGIFQGNVDFDPGPGTNTLTATGLSDAFILKLDATGNFVWVKHIGGPGTSSFPIAIKLDKTGNICTAGHFSKTVDFDPGPATYTIASGSASAWNVFMEKLDPAGNFIWAKSINSTAANVASGMVLDTAGNMYTTGQYSLSADFNPGAATFSMTSVGNYDSYISRLDASGNFVWAKSIGGPNIDFGHSVAIDNLNNVYSTGMYQSTADFNPGTGTYTITSAGGYDIYVSKLDASGNFIWAKSMGGANDDHSTFMALDTVGSAYVTGAYSGPCDFDPGAATYTIGSVSPSSDAYILKLDAAGNFAWAKNIGGTQSKNGNFILLDRDENVFSLGDFQGTADFDPEPTTYTVTSTGITDSYIHKMSQCHSISANTTAQPVSCYAMANGSATIQAVGGTALTYSWSNGDTNPVAVNLTSGTYSCVVTNTCGNSITRTVTVTQPLPVSVVISSIPPGSVICNGQSITLNATGAVSFTWSNGISNGTSFTPTMSTTYSVVGADANNCKDSASVTIVVNNSTSSTVTKTECAPFTFNMQTYTISGVYSQTLTNANGCDSLITLNLTALQPSAFSQSVNLCAGQVFAVGSTTYNASGNYTATLVSANGCDSIVTTNLTIEQPIDLSTSQNGITLSANVAGLSYQWINCSDSSQIAGETNQSFTPAANGNYAVIIITGNCRDTSACTNITTVGINEKDIKQQVLIYPNPTNSIFTIQLNAPAQIVVTDALSRIVISDHKTKGPHDIDLTQTDSGIYFIKVIYTTGQEVVKLIKQ